MKRKIWIWNLRGWYHILPKGRGNSEIDTNVATKSNAIEDALTSFHKEQPKDCAYEIQEVKLICGVVCRVEDFIDNENL